MSVFDHKTGKTPQKGSCGFEKAFYWVKAKWRHLRVHRRMTWVLGPQYKRSRDLIEIDITYRCNLYCQNCNRSVRQAPEALDISLESIRQFISDSKRHGKTWRGIRILGGEPTLHPHFQEIVSELTRFRDSIRSEKLGDDCLLQVVTNGHGPFVNEQLARLPSDIFIENSCKTHKVQKRFGPFNLAPVDDPAYKNAAYSNGCNIMETCGMGLTPLGYYPCAIAGGIDRIQQIQLGRKEMPDDKDDMIDLLEHFCRLCGRFRDGHRVPKKLRPELTYELISPSWDRIYQEWWSRRTETKL